MKIIEITPGEYYPSVKSCVTKIEEEFIDVQGINYSRPVRKEYWFDSDEVFHKVKEQWVLFSWNFEFIGLKNIKFWNHRLFGEEWLTDVFGKYSVKTYNQPLYFLFDNDNNNLQIFKKDIIKDIIPNKWANTWNPKKEINRRELILKQNIVVLDVEESPSFSICIDVSHFLKLDFLIFPSFYLNQVYKFYSEFFPYNILSKPLNDIDRIDVINQFFKLKIIYNK